jgi:hypothetical protein
MRYLHQLSGEVGYPIITANLCACHDAVRLLNFPELGCHLAVEELHLSYPILTFCYLPQGR